MASDMRAFCQTRLIPCEEAAPGDPQSAWGSTKTISNINVELFDPAPIRGQDSEPIHTLGVKEVVKWLNARGHRTRQGNTFGVGSVHKLLTNTIYIGTWRFNQTSSKTRQRKPHEEIVEVSVPAIVDHHVFSCVQQQLRARNPKVTAPRITVGPTLLTGLAVCATCGGGMMLRTGTSKNGRVYRYYTCSSCATKGKTVC